MNKDIKEYLIGYVLDHVLPVNKWTQENMYKAFKDISLNEEATDGKYRTESYKYSS